MKSKELEEFKEKLLYKAIHNEERSDYFRSIINKAEILWRTSKMEPFDFNDNSFNQYHSLIYRINYTQKLILLANDLENNGYKLQGLVEIEKGYYQTIFKNRIKDAKKSLVKLRPYVLENTKEMKTDHRITIKEDPERKKFFGSWFPSNP